jgi:hypothetical protein
MIHPVLGQFIYEDDILIVCDNNLSNINNILKHFKDGSPELTFTLELTKKKKAIF